MEKVRNTLSTLIFNAAETVLIFLVGKLLNISIENILGLMLVFVLSRGLFGESLHFKTWYRCLIWSLLVMLSLFVVCKVDLVVSIVLAIFSAFIMTGRSNISDLYCWKKSDEPSKYQDIIDYIKYHSLDDKLLEFERKMKEKDSLEYLIYKYRFIDGKTFSEISDILDMETPRIAQHLDKIAFAIRLYCGI